MNETQNTHAKPLCPIYVAASSKERMRYREFLAKIPSEMTITYNWADTFDDVELATAAGATPPTKAQLSQIGARCFRGVDLAEIVIFLVPTTPTRGFWVELGIAIAQAAEGKKFAVMTIGDGDHLDCWSGFGRHAHFANDADAVAALEAIAADSGKSIAQLSAEHTAAVVAQTNAAIAVAFNASKEA